MCPLENDHCVLVCDLAITRVREATSHTLGGAVQLTPLPGQGTRVEVSPTEDAQAFQTKACAAMAAARQQDAKRHQ